MPPAAPRTLEDGADLAVVTGGEKRRKNARGTDRLRPAMTCPWDALEPGTVAFCEARLCAWVAEPSNAWSSFAYVLAGAWLAATHAVRARNPQLWAVVCAQMLIGVGSFAFHATGSFAGELVDQAGMFLLSCLILAFAAGRAHGLGPARTAALYGGATLLSTLSLLLVPPAGIPLFAVQLAAGLALEGRLWQRAPTPAHRHLFTGIGLFLFSFGIWLLDITGVACRPDNHLLTGHAVWHVLNAISITRLYWYYAAARALPGAEPTIAAG